MILLTCRLARRRQITRNCMALDFHEFHVQFPFVKIIVSMLVTKCKCKNPVLKKINPTKILDYIQYIQTNIHRHRRTYMHTLQYITYT